jgi:hypothetical protein
VHVALHGHQHKAKLSIYMNLPFSRVAPGSPIHVISNGSTGVKRERLPHGENNTYCVFSVTDRKLRLQIRELKTNAQRGLELFDQVLPLEPKQ